MNVIRAIGLSVILLLINDCPAFGGYPYSYNDCPQCGNCCPDKWNFCINNCTSYVAYKLNHVFHDDQPVFMNNNYWHNAKNWKQAAINAGIDVDHNPRVGSVAWWGSGDYGHVAYVEEVNGDRVDISEYNVPLWCCEYGERPNLTADFYIHIFDEESDLPDLVVREVYLTDHKTSFLAGEAFRIYARIKNVGEADIDHDIRIRYYRSTGKKIDTDPTSLGTDDIKKENLEKGESHPEDKGTTAPSTPGTYNITVKADCDKEVDEEHESNNWYDPPLVFEVFPVMPPNWSVVNQEGDPKVYLFYNGKKWWILNSDILFALGFSWDQLLTYPAGNLDQYPNGQDIVSYGLLGQLGPHIYLFEAGQWHYLPNWAYMDCRGGQHPENVLPITQALFDMYGEGAAVTPCNNLPEGWLDIATCDEITGWARDPDTTSPIRVHVYADGPAGQGTIVANELADLYRSDLPFADKNHGYSIPTPSNLKDGQSHTIYVYAIDSEGGDNPLLNNSPQSISCCTYAINPTSANFNASGGTGSVDVTTQSGCSWTATSNDTWIHITSGGSGTGSGTVNYSVDENTGSEAHTGTMTIAGETFTVTQDGKYNQSPVIDSFTAYPTSGNAPLIVSFSCDAHDPDGYITEYRWDFDGDGNSDETTTVNTTTYTYQNAETYYAKVTVVDNDDATTTSDPITINVGQISADIKINGSDGPITISTSDTLSITIELDPGIYPGVPADWWCVADSPFGWYYYDDTGTWLPGFEVSYQGPLFDLTPPLEVLNTSDLPIGSYTFYFGVDGNRNGNLDEPLYHDSVEVNITP